MWTHKPTDRVDGVDTSLEAIEPVVGGLMVGSTELVLPSPGWANANLILRMLALWWEGTNGVV
jgi:hypothetical protein